MQAMTGLQKSSKDWEMATELPVFGFGDYELVGVTMARDEDEEEDEDDDDEDDELDDDDKKYFYLL